MKFVEFKYHKKTNNTIYVTWLCTFVCVRVHVCKIVHNNMYERVCICCVCACACMRDYVFCVCACAHAVNGAITHAHAHIYALTQTYTQHNIHVIQLHIISRVMGWLKAILLGDD